MIKITVTLEEDDHLKLLEIQLSRKKQKKNPTALNKIASEILAKALKKKTPTSRPGFFDYQSFIKPEGGSEISFLFPVQIL